MKTDEELGAIIKAEIEQADGWEGSELEAHRTKALDYYHARLPAQGKADESAVVSTDVADMVNAVLAQLTPMITHDALITFEPEGDEDEDLARMETKAVAKGVMDDNRGYIEFQSALKSAALSRNAYAKVWTEEAETVEVRTFRERPRDEINVVLKVLNEQKGVEAELEEIEDAGRLETPDPMTGEVESVAVSTAKVKVKKVSRVFRWRAVDPLNVLFQAQSVEWDLQRMRFFAELSHPTRSDLVAQGYSRAKVKSLETVEVDAREAAQARARGESFKDEAKTPDQEKVEVHECFVLIDMDGDGVSERWRVVVGDKSTVLEKELVQWVPYASGTMFIQPHKHEGEDLFDRLEQTQNIKTSAYRRWLENQHAATWNRTVVGQGINRQDWEEARAGAVVKCNGSPQENIWQPPVFDVGPSCAALLDREDKNRTERAGAALDMQSADAQLVGETMGGIIKQYSVKEALAAMMAHNFCETFVRDVYLLFHRTLRAFSDGPMKVTLRDEAKRVDPSTWPARSQVNVDPGLTPGQRAAVEQGLTMLMQWQTSMAQLGQAGALVNPDDMYKTGIDFLRAKGVGNPEQYITDPNSTRAQKAARSMAQNQQRQAQSQQRMLELQIRLKERELELEKYKIDQDQATSLYEAELKAGLEESKQIQETVRDVRQAGRAVNGGPGGAGEGAA